jgi:hypothetical protein
MDEEGKSYNDSEESDEESEEESEEKMPANAKQPDRASPEPKNTFKKI